MIKIFFQRISEKFGDIPLPSYQTNGSAGMDIAAAVETEYILQPGAFGAVPTNLRVEIPEGYEIQVRPRSGLSVKYGVTVLNSPGTIDSDYRGEIKIILINHGKHPFEIKKGERIAQLVIAEVKRAEISESNKLNETIRGENGFGSTGL